MVSPTGLSSQAIAYRGQRDHPHDPADLLRCVRYCEGSGISTSLLFERMAGRSVEWDRLLPHWDDLVALLNREMSDRTDDRAPLTYAEMKRILADGVRCETCGGTGRGKPCPKCKGSGRRGRGRCRAANCYGGAGFCPTCHGRGYTGGKW